jgi:hypothetical protein
MDPTPSDAATTAVDDVLTSRAAQDFRQPTEEDIRMRAYHRYLERGAQHGADFDDWVAAERELRKR